MGTNVGLKPDSMVYDPDNNSFYRAGDSFGSGIDYLRAITGIDYPDYAAEAISDAQKQDYINSLLEEQLTPEEKEAQLLGLSVEQINAKTEDILDSILKSQGENETGFVNESARIAAESILKGKIAQAGVTDPAAQEAALNSAMESLEGGASGLEAVKAAASGTKDYVEALLKTAKDVLDKGYDATIGKLPEILTPEGILADIVSGNVTGVFEIGETGGPLPGATSPIFGGQVGTVGGGTNVGIMTTGNAVLDAVIRAAEGGVDAKDIESVVGAVISANTGIPTDVVNAGIKGTKEAINAAKTVVGANVTGEDDDTDDTTDVTLTGGTLTTKTCDDGSLVGIDEACPEDITTLIGGDETGTGDSTLMGPFETDPCSDPTYAAENPAKCDPNYDPCSDPTYAAENPAKCDPNYDPCSDPTYAAENPAKCDPNYDPCSDPTYAAENPAKCDPNYDPCDNPKYATLNPVKCGGVSGREIIDDDLVAKTNPCDDPVYAAQNPDKCGTSVNLCDDPVYAAQNPDKCGTKVNLCDDPVYAAQNPDKCGTKVNLCDDPVYAAQNPDKCGTKVNLCDNPVYAAQNPAKCLTGGGNPCDKPDYAAANPDKCGTNVKLCDDPVYAAQNPAKCGIVGGDPCDDPAYAASRPGECGTIGGDPCDDPAYAAANPAECGVVVPPEEEEEKVFVPTTGQGYRAVQTKPGGVVDIDYLYDIAGPSIFAPTMEAEDKYSPLGMYSPYAEGGIVQDYDIEELIRFLENQRG